METDLVPQPQTPLSEPPTVSAPAPVAPWWHTLSIIAVILLVSFVGARTNHGPASGSGGSEKMGHYLTTMVWEWLLFFYVWWGVTMRGGKLRDLLGERWKQVEDVLLDVAIAAIFLIAWLVFAAGIAVAFKLVHPGQVTHQLEETRRNLGFLVPRTGLEMTIWLGLSLTAGICEETVFRGYLQKQFLSLNGSAFLAILLQGLCFGAAHGYEGTQKMVLIALLGIFFGVLTYFRKALYPAIIAHATYDFAAGLALRFLVK